MLIADLCAGVARLYARRHAGGTGTRIPLPAGPLSPFEAPSARNPYSHCGWRSGLAPCGAPRNDGVDGALGAGVTPGPPDRQDANADRTADARRVDWGDQPGRRSEICVRRTIGQQGKFKDEAAGGIRSGPAALDPALERKGVQHQPECE